MEGNERQFPMSFVIPQQKACVRAGIPLEKRFQTWNNAYQFILAADRRKPYGLCRPKSQSDRDRKPLPEI
jgi:hypothetical protein